jgi:Amt family ammonium transporter
VPWPVRSARWRSASSTSSGTTTRSTSSASTWSGLVGTVGIGFLATSTGLFYGGGVRQLVVQVLVALFAVAWSAVATLVVGLAVKAIIGLRLPEEDEVEGIDFADHGESAYDLSSASGSRRPSVLTEKTAVQEGANA